MKDTDLLLNDDERTVAWNEGVESGRADWIWAGAEAVARAQAAKALAVLADYAGLDPCCRVIIEAELRQFAQQIGLTWPPKES